MAVRLFVLQGHYRKPLDFTKDAISASINSWQTLKAGLLFGNRHRAALSWPVANIQSSLQESRVERFQAAMEMI